MSNYYEHPVHDRNTAKREELFNATSQTDTASCHNVKSAAQSKDFFLLRWCYLIFFCLLGASVYCWYDLIRYSFF